MHAAISIRSDSFNTIDMENYYTILPRENKKISSSYNSKEETMAGQGFCYNSSTNDKWLSVKETNNLIFDLAS